MKYFRIPQHADTGMPHPKNSKKNMEYAFQTWMHEFVWPSKLWMVDEASVALCKTSMEKIRPQGVGDLIGLTDAEHEKLSHVARNNESPDGVAVLKIGFVHAICSAQDKEPQDEKPVLKAKSKKKLLAASA